MRQLFFCLPMLLLASGCATQASYVDSDATLGRIVVYRNGVAYYERTAEVRGDSLELKVPADKVDDFLKSLTVLDADTKKPAPIAYPTKPGARSADGTVTMQVKVMGSESAPKRLKLTYVTEAPSWKPSYRVVLRDDGRVDLLGWAIVDNTSGEDWKNVKLGVGSSSALSFRYDLKSIRTVSREMLRPDDLFAQAPPTGGTVFQNESQAVAVLDVVDDATLGNLGQFRDRRAEAGKGEPVRLGSTSTRKSPPQEPIARAAPPKRTKAADGAVGGGMSGSFGGGGVKLDAAQRGQGADGQEVANSRVNSLADRIRRENRQVVVEGFAGKDDNDKGGRAMERANKLRQELIDSGVAPDQVIAVANMNLEAERGGARVVDGKNAAAAPKEKAESGALLDPIGTSHFESKTAMNVPAGTSAMVSILDTQTAGEVVYLFDAESARGSKTFAFRAVRLDNPTTSTLETGPVTVFGEGRFIGEGFTDPIPGKSTSFVPFALDRQVLAEEKASTEDGIARLLTAQRGVFSVEMKHTKKRHITLRNRLQTDAVVYVRHTVTRGFSLVDAPKDVERLGESHLFRVLVPAKGTTEVVIAEQTPVLRSVDLRASSGLELVRAYASSAALDGDLKKRIEGIVLLQREVGTLDEKIETARQQMEEYRSRMNELHIQLVTLKAVKTAGPLMRSLEKKLEEISEKLSKATVDLVGKEEQRMIARIKLQDSIAELSLEKSNEPAKSEAEKPAAAGSSSAGKTAGTAIGAK